VYLFIWISKTEIFVLTSSTAWWISCIVEYRAATELENGFAVSSVLWFSTINLENYKILQTVICCSLLSSKLHFIHTVSEHKIFYFHVIHKLLSYISPHLLKYKHTSSLPVLRTLFSQKTVERVIKEYNLSMHNSDIFEDFNVKNVWLYHFNQV